MLLALVAGLLLPLAGSAMVVPAALVATLAGRRVPALVAVAAVLGGASLADARLAALDAGVARQCTAGPSTARAVVLEPVRERAAGPAVARVRLLEGPGAGEQVVLRVRRNAYAGRLWSPPRSGGAAAPGRAAVAPARGWPEVGDVVVVRGVEPLGARCVSAAPQRARARSPRRASCRPASGAAASPGRWTASGARPSAGSSSGLARAGGGAAARHGARRGRAADARTSGTTSSASGLAHILAVSGQNVMLLAALVLGACALAGVPLRARLLLAVAVIALYVPLAGGGPSIQRAGVMGIAGLVAALAGRPSRRWYALLLAAALTLALNPRAAGEPGLAAVVRGGRGAAGRRARRCARRSPAGCRSRSPRRRRSRSPRRSGRRR